jgi:hypothetical protein
MTVDKDWRISTLVMKSETNNTPTPSNLPKTASSPNDSLTSSDRKAALQRIGQAMVASIKSRPPVH